MEAFLGAHLVRLRCPVRGCDYLTADEDASGVLLTRNREQRGTIWSVEIVPDGRTKDYVVFRGHSGGYLCATNRLARTGGPPGAVLAAQLTFIGDPAPPEMFWSAARREGHVVMRNRAGGYLRANGRYLRWRRDVTVADDDGNAMMLWSLEAVPLGLRSLLIHPVLHERIDGDGNEEEIHQYMQQFIKENGGLDLPSRKQIDGQGNEEEIIHQYMQQSIKENGGLDLPSQKQGLLQLKQDCLYEIALKLPTRADILRFAAASRHLWKTIGTQAFKDSYYTTNGTSMAELIGVLNTREIQIVALSVHATVQISLNGLDNRLGIHIIDCHNGLLLLKDDFSGAMIIYDPTNSRSIPLHPPPVPEDCKFVAAGISPDTSGQYSQVIAIYARRSLFHYEQMRALIATCNIHPEVTKWTTYDNEIDFDLKAAEIKPPSVIANGELHLLNYNNFIISVCIKKPHGVRTLPLPFQRQMLTPSHILGTTKKCELALVAREQGDLMVWEYHTTEDQAGVEARLYKRLKGFPHIPFFAFAQDNFLLLSDHLICLNMMTEELELPFIIPDEELELRDIIPYEMAWPPRPVLAS